MSEEFKVEIVNPEKSFLVKEDVSEVVVPAFEGEMGVLKDHISIISFLKPGIIKILSKSGDENFYVEDGIVEFKNNNLSILTSSIFNLTDLDKSKQQDLLKQAEEEEGKSNQILEFTREIKKHPMDFRLRIIEIIWKIVYSDGTNDNYESNLIRRICGLLYISDKDNGIIKTKVQNLFKN